MDLRVVIFVPALAGSALAGFFFLAFAAHHYLTVLESTAAGAKEVTWVSESLIDNFWKPFYLAWLICLWLGPAYVIGRTLAGSTGLAWLTLAVPVFVAWALYPVSQLSSLCASSVWMPLHPQVFARLLQKPAVVAGFFVFTLPLFALGGLAFRWTFLTKGEWHLLLAGMPLLVFASFLYARLLGRLAFALMFTKDLLKRKKKKKPKSAKTETTRTPDTKPAPVQPSELPAISTPDGELVGYNVLISDDPPAPKKRVKAEAADDEPPAESESSRPGNLAAQSENHPSQDRPKALTDEDDDATPYSLNPSEVKDEERIPEAVKKPTEEELSLLDRRDAPKPQKQVWSGELFAFLGQPATLSAMLLLTGIGLVAGVLVRVARDFNPAD